MTESEKLKNLEIREGARDIVATYCEALDSSNSELLERILRPDVVLHRSPDNPVKGRQAVIDFFMAAFAEQVESRRHFVTNPVVKLLDQGTARVKSYLLALHYHEGELKFAWGEYRFDVVLEDGEFQLKELVIHLDMPISPLKSMLGATQS